MLGAPLFQLGNESRTYETNAGASAKKAAAFLCRLGTATHDEAGFVENIESDLEIRIERCRHIYLLSRAAKLFVTAVCGSVVHRQSQFRPTRLDDLTELVSSSPEPPVHV